MTDRDSAPPKDPAKAARDKRLAEALRANLRRRKASDSGTRAGPAASVTEKTPADGDKE